MIQNLKKAEINFMDDQEDSASEDENDDRDEKLRKILIIQKHQQVSRKAVREFCNAFDDEDVKANGLESHWKKFRKNVTDLYKLNIVCEVTKLNDLERAFVYVNDFDNYLTQIIALKVYHHLAWMNMVSRRFGSKLVAMADQFIDTLTTC